ncbi:cell division protein ZapA [Erythrobacter sp.]|uniref:cell division protein ZapA n=1 Tax=Erythrobacter sp. TaxID=1042 RepID=UPI001B169A29|nr:cell division protein ZapA [Erythrobacter sp.]MBO6526861.1 cell division protein ZapA [Erythrobacter sp.]MBO6528534.1 cell division protein ZapA [Erythrobacter sp.]
MSDVTLSVGGRNYTVSCADGQEEHVQRLAGVIDDKLGSMGANLSSQEAKNLLFAALLLADELDEAKKQAVPAGAPGFDTDRLAGQLERIALALENAASTLESGADSY